MVAGKNTEWLKASPCGESTTIIETDRLQKVIGNLHSPSEDKLSVVLVIESRRRSLFPKVEACSSNQAGTIHLRQDTSNAYPWPTLVVTGIPIESEKKLRTTNKDPKNGRRLEFPLQPQDCESLLLSRLLYLFSDVLCFICHDILDIDQTTRLLICLAKRRNKITSIQIPPELHIFVASQMDLKVAKSRIQDRFQNSGLGKMSDFFQRVSVETISKGNLTSPNRRERLHRRLRKSVQRMRLKKMRSRLLFTGNHLFDLVYQALPTIARGFVDVVELSRASSPVPSDLHNRLCDFLGLITTPSDLRNFGAEVVASYLFSKHFSLDIHCMYATIVHQMVTNIVAGFRLEDVFRSLYREICIQASKKIQSPDSGDTSPPHSDFAEAVFRFMGQILSKYRTGSATVNNIHQTVLKRYAEKWVGRECQTTCLACCSRTPQCRLECGHSFCDACFKLHGEPSPLDCRDWLVPRCFLCQTQFVQTRRLRLHPPTAGVGILCLDGGGVRGVVSTTILELLQERIGLDIPIQEYFQQVVGISAGSCLSWPQRMQ